MTIRAAILAGAFAFSTGAAQANTIQTTALIGASGTQNSVTIVEFLVTLAGLFDLFTDGPTTDPELLLFSDDNSNGSLDLADPLIAEDDDSCVAGSLLFCNAAGSFENALIDDIALDPGAYFLAVSDFDLTEDEARAGVNDTTANGALTGDVAITISSAAGAVSLPSVPLPASGLLMAFGLLALGLRKRG